MPQITSILVLNYCHQRARHNWYTKETELTHTEEHIFLYIYQHRAPGLEQRPSGGTTPSNPQASAPVPQPVVNETERMCQRHGSDQLPPPPFTHPHPPPPPHPLESTNKACNISAIHRFAIWYYAWLRPFITNLTSVHILLICAQRPPGTQAWHLYYPPETILVKLQVIWLLFLTSA